MRRNRLPVGPKSPNVFGAATRRRRCLAGVFSVLALVLFAGVAHAQNTISTVAGSAAPNNVSPTAATIEGPQAIARDASGNLYIVNDYGVIHKVVPGTTAPSTMSIYAGNDAAGFSANGTLATAAFFDEPTGAALDASGNLYFSDQNNCVVREIVASSGVVNTVAGTPGVCSYSGDNGPATSAQLNFPQGVAIDGSGNLYIADIGNSVVRRVSSSGTITTYAGTPQSSGFPTNGALATSTLLNGPEALAADTSGNLFIADQYDNVICRVDASSKALTIVAGTGTFGFSGDGGPATSATMRAPDGVAVDSAGNIYISDSENAVVREVFASGPNAGEIQTIVGTTTFGFNGDGAATAIELTNPSGLFVDSATGNLWIGDFWSDRVRLYTASTKTVSTVVGNGLVGDGGAATSASLYEPRSPALDSLGNLYIVDAFNSRIREVTASNQTISTVVGNGIPCAFPTDACGDGGSPTLASVFIPRTVTVEASGNLLIGDGGDNRVRQVAAGIITTIAGTGNQCTTATLPCGDGGPATSASLFDPRAAVVDSNGNIYFTDSQDNRIRRIDATTKIITTVAGNGPDGNAPVGCPGSYTGDGGPAVDATLGCPLGLDIDSNGNLYVSDTYNNRIRKIDATTQIITTVAGNGAQGFSGDNGLATSAMLNIPNRVSVNAAGNFFISDTGNERIRRVEGTTGIITTFAGNGSFGFSGDGGPALSASFATPTGVVVDNLGDMYVGDLYNDRIRLVLLNPNVTLSSSTAAFSNQPINMSATLPVTVTNSGDAPLTITSIAISSGAFSLSANPCPAAPTTLAVGAQCVLQIAFMPTQFIAYTGTITISDNGPTSGSQQIINVSGTGAAALTVQVTAGTGSVTSSPAGITACATTCTANFTGNSSVILTAAPGTNFTFSGFTNCASTGALTCSVTMSAAETVTAAFTSSGGGPAPVLAIAKTHTGNFTQGQQGATYTVTVSNGANGGPTTGTVTVTDTIPTGLTLVSMAGTGWTCATNSCTRGDVLLAGASYPAITVTVNVASNAAASVTNSVSVSGGGSATANATNPTTITTSGGGGGSGIATVTPNPLAFGGVQAGNSSALSFTLQNTGTGPLGSIAFSVTNPDYAITTNTCATTLAAGSAPCTITVTFTPSFQAPDTGAVVITDDSSAGPTTELLSGAGVGPIYVLPFEMFYDGITPGTISPAQTATLFNTTDTGLSVTGVTFVGNAASDFSVTSNGCGDGADPSCPIGVAFTPSTTVLGPRTADLTIATNGGGPFVSHLTGNGAIRHLPGFTGNSFPPNDDDSTSAVNLPFSMNFFGTTYTQLYVNNNGNVTFGEAFGTYTPFGLTGNIGVPIIAPFFADVYTLTPGSDVVHYGVDTVNGQQAFGVNWENVAYFAEPDGEDCPPAILLNSFQLIVISRPDTGAGNFDMEFNYDKIQWETGSASGGTCGLGGSSAAVGYSNGTGDAGTNFQLPGSLVNGALLDVPTAAGFPGLIHSDLSSTMLGRYEFQVRNGAVQSADLGLTMTQSANPVPAGSNQTYTLTVTNAGPSDATNTTVSDTLPTNATLVSATPSQGAACTTAAVVVCNLGTVANAGTATVTIVVTVNAGATGTLVNNASVTSDLPDPNPGNNTASASATIGASTNVLLTITLGGNGTGTVRSTPAGINCGATCSFSFASGTTVVLTATASDGSTFSGWGAGPCEGTGTCTFTITTATTVVANFAQSTNNFTLSVNEAGTGTGTVTSSPAGINCPTTCSASFTSGQVVTLTATAANGSTFAGWSGVAGCPGTGTCTVTLNAAVTVTATFNSSSPVIITVAPGSPSTVVTSPGSSAVFGLTLTGTAGTTGTVQLGCTSSSQDITCNIVPSSIVLTGTAVNVAIVVQTFCKGAVPGFRPLPGGFAGGLAMLLASMSLCGAMWTIKRRPRLALSFGVLILIAVGMSACSSLPTSPSGQATPPGSYPLVVTATAPNGAKSSVNLVLKVQ